MPDVVNDVVINYKSTGLDKVGPEIKQVSTNLDGLVVSSTGAEKATASLENRFASLERQLGTAEGNAQKFAKVQDSVNKAVAQNPELQGRANEVLAAAAAKYGQVEAATTALANAHKGLDTQGQAAFHSIRSMVEQLAMGVPPTQILTQQLNHLSYAASGEGGLVGAFKQVGSFVGSMITPMTAVAAGITAVSAAALYAVVNLDKLQVASQRATSGAGARTGTTVEDINKFVAQNKGAATGLSDTELRDFANAATQNGNIVISKLHDVNSAIQGFANQTGKSVSDASKAFVQFGQDPVKAMDAMAQAFGALDQPTQNAVKHFVEIGDKTSATNVILDAYSKQLKDAADKMTYAEKAARLLSTTMGREMQQPAGPGTQLETARTNLNQAIAAGPDQSVAAIQGQAAAMAKYSQSVQDASSDFETLQTKQQAVLNQNIAAAMNDTADKANKATEALIPQIAQIEVLTQEINKLKAAQDAGVAGPNTGAALTAAQNLLQTERDSMAAAAAHNDYVKQLGQNYQGVSLKAAEVLDSLKDQLSIAKATTAAGKEAAQKAADFNEAMRQTGDAAGATEIAMERAALRTAQAADSAKQLADNMWTAATAATSVAGMGGPGNTNQFGLPAGMSPEQANAPSNAPPNRYSGAVGWQGTSGGGQIIGGTLEQTIPQQNPALAVLAAQNRARTQLSAQQIAQLGIDQATASGNIDQAIAALKGASSLDTSAQSTYISAVTSLFGMKIQQTPDKASQGQIMAQEMAYLQAQPKTLDVMNTISSLRQSIDQLNTSTQTLNSTNQELLSPYYTTDPRTSHIGFRSQGMAAGGYVDVPGGVSSNDNMLATVPVASGERIYVDPMNSKRGSGGNSQTININVPIAISGNANKDEIGRTVYQNMQIASRQIAAATR